MHATMSRAATRVWVLQCIWEITLRVKTRSPACARYNAYESGGHTRMGSFKCMGHRSSFQMYGPPVVMHAIMRGPQRQYALQYALQYAYRKLCMLQ